MRDEAGRTRLKMIGDRLAEAGVRWVVFAGAAAYCTGSRRKVSDVDILVKSEDLDKARKALGSIDGFDVWAGGEIETPDGNCCFFLDDEMVKRASWRRLFGVRIPVIPVEDNIVFKAVVQRGEEEGKHDVEDIRAMADHEKLDLEYLEKRIRDCRAERRVKPLLKRLGILQG